MMSLGLAMGVDCSGHGVCRTVDSSGHTPECLCESGYQRQGSLNCVPSGGDGDSDADVEPDADDYRDADTSQDADADTEPDAELDGDSETALPIDADVESDGCMSHSECLSEMASQCNPASGECLPCERDEHCSHFMDKPACGPDHICHQCSTTNSEACPTETPVCSPSEQRCVACIQNADCPSGQICNPNTEECVEMCLSCETSVYCTDELGPGFFCAVDWFPTDPFRCFLTDSECERPWRNIDGVCYPPIETSCIGLQEFGEPCTEDFQCGINFTESDAFCHLSGYCTYPCSEHEECPIGTRCYIGVCSI